LGDYAKMLGHLYGLNSKEIENLYHCMSIYDIGLIRIPKEELESENSRYLGAIQSLELRF